MPSTLQPYCTHVDLHLIVISSTLLERGEGIDDAGQPKFSQFDVYLELSLCSCDNFIFLLMLIVKNVKGR